MRLRSATRARALFAALIATAAVARSEYDPLWLTHTRQQSLRKDTTEAQQARPAGPSSPAEWAVVVVGQDGEAPAGGRARTDGNQRQEGLQGIADELNESLQRLTSGRVVSSCCSSADRLLDGHGGYLLQVEVDAGFKRLGQEGFAITTNIADRRARGDGDRDDGSGRVSAWRVQARTISGAWYGAYHTLAMIRRGEAPETGEVVNEPALALRVWNMWDNLDGTIERGYGGPSIVWPWALGTGTASDRSRFEDMIRILKSAGINALVLNNVNSCGHNVDWMKTDFLGNVTKNLGSIMAKYAITPYFSACFAAPDILDQVSCDPLSADAQHWWANKVDQIYKLMPNFGGFLVKADSEGNKGPQSYGRNEAQGANLLARALKKHGGIVMWRAFVYGGAISQVDRAKQAFMTFMPLDGQFDDNVVLQIKNGPMDFQVREPLSPLLGSLRQTNIIMEVQASQEYTGQQIHAVNLVPMWKSYLDFDTLYQDLSPNSTIADILAGQKLGGMAAVSNLGSFDNWTGSVLGASNTFGFGQLAWDPYRNPESINRQWAEMSFQHSIPHKAKSSDHSLHGPALALGREADSDVIETVVDILKRSWPIYESYTSPLGIGFICNGGAASGPCAPKTSGPGPGPGGVQCPLPPPQPKYEAGRNNAAWGRYASRNHSDPALCKDNSTKTVGDYAGRDHYWLNPCSDYIYSNYSAHGIGCDRSSSSSGTGYAAQYSPAMERIYNDPSTCPTNLLLFFHNVAWDYPVPFAGSNGTKPLLQLIMDQHDEGVAGVQDLKDSWASLEGKVDNDLLLQVDARFSQQLNDAAVFRDVIVGYYINLTLPVHA